MHKSRSALTLVICTRQGTHPAKRWARSASEYEDTTHIAEGNTELVINVHAPLFHSVSSGGHRCARPKLNSQHLYVYICSVCIKRTEILLRAPCIRVQNILQRRLGRWSRLNDRRTLRGVVNAVRAFGVCLHACLQMQTQTDQTDPFRPHAARHAHSQTILTLEIKYPG